ncbi:MAG: hypothetical protein LBJ36_04495 [Synergistaceae bacterium]|jgi:hypothetical protein|nr:hypothetical protein [Synergistaceae bacterium]
MIKRKENDKENDKNILLIAVGGLALFFLTMLIVPIADDWHYLTSPTIQSGYRIAQYRRFFDILIGLFNQAHPETFPWLNRVLIVFTHTVGAVFLYKIAREILDIRAKIALAFALLFLIGGNTIVTVINYDCFNQTGSLMFGAIGIYLFANAKSIAKKFIVYFVSCTLALCAKEAGIVYFAIIPLFGFIKNLNDGDFNTKSEIKTLAKFYVPGFICALAYYLSPIIQSEQLWIYGMRNDPITSYVIGIARRLGFSYTQIDQTSIITIIRSKILTIEVVFTSACVLLSIPILLLSLSVFVKLVKDKNKSAIVLLLIVLQSIIVFTPTLIALPGGSIWSQNCIVFFANIAFAYLLNKTEGKALRVCVSSFVISSIISGAGSMYQGIQTGVRQKNAIEAIEARYDHSKEVSTYKVFNLNSNRSKVSSYPFRLRTIQQIFDFGRDMVCIFGYDAKCTRINLTNDEFEYKGNKDTLPSYVEMTDDELLAHAQSEAQNAVDSGDYDLALVVLHTDEFYLYQK